MAQFVPRMDTASRQIQAWARGGDYENESRDPGRHSGQLSDNITEQRVLQSRILDLARERYRILSEREYQKNRFIDRQQKKTKVMKDLLRNIDLEQYRHKSCNTVDVLREKSLRMRLMILARHQGYKVVGDQEVEEMMILYNNMKVSKTDPPRTADDDDDEDEFRFLDRSARHSTLFGSRPHHPKSALPSISHHSNGNRASWVDNRRSRALGMSCVPRLEVVKDPRCSRLLQTLTPNYSPKPPVQSVGNLVGQIDTLRMQTRSKSEILDRRGKMDTLRFPTASANGNQVQIIAP